MCREENIVLITVDSLRADHLSLYGYKEKTSPTLDRLANEGVVFTEAISNGSHTMTSFPAILTSAYGSMYGGCGYLSKERTSIAEVIGKEGYSTAAFHSNPYLSKACNYDRGFDVFYDSIENDFSLFKFKSLDKLAKLSGQRRKATTLLSLVLKIYSHIQPYRIPYERAEIITGKAVNWLRECNNRFFIWIHYMDTHWPWVPLDFMNGSVSVKEAMWLWWKMLLDPSSLSDEDLEKLIKLYDGEIRHLDHSIGIFFRSLKKMGLYDNSLILLTSDHGEEFKEHGDIGHHNLKLYEQLIHVPLVIKFPTLYGGTVISNLVSLLDIAPTITDWLGISKPEKWIGSSLLPLLAGERLERTGVISEGRIKQGDNMVSYRSKRWKLILDEERKERELYDLLSDPKETKNLSEIMPDKVEEFEVELSKHLLKTTGSVVSLPKIDHDERIKDRLKALGYFTD